MSRRLFSVVLAAATVSLSTPTWAGRAIQFYLTATSGDKDAKILCRGPWGRLSACVRAFGTRDANFYQAWDNAFSAFGSWSCSYGTAPEHRYDCGLNPRNSTAVDFCLGENHSQVNLVAEGGKLKVNLPEKCSSAIQNGTLDLEPATVGAAVAASVAASGETAPVKIAASSSDVDTYAFPAKAGEKLVVKLDRDGGAGSDGSLVGLRVLDAVGGVIAQRRGKIPLELLVTAPSAGIQIAVESVSAKDDKSFEGGYTIEVAPKAGQLGDRLTEPGNDVEN